MRLAMSQRTTCRVCGGADVRPFLHFERYPLSDNILDDDGPAADAREVLADYRAHYCDGCGVVQNLTDFDWSGYYQDYDYTASTSAFARAFMDKVTAAMAREFGLGEGDTALELGSSDGAQLASFAAAGFRVFGFEPSFGLAERARAAGVPTTTALFDREGLRDIPRELLPAQVICSFYTFDHLPDPQGALEAMAEVLDRQRGVVLIEVHDLERIVARKEACLFCHEHTVYPDRESLARMFERAGLRLVHDQLVPENERRGNSLLVAAVHCDNPYRPKLLPESDLLRALREWPTYARFADDVRAAHARLADTVRAWRREGRRVAGFGASARSISTLSIAGLTRDDVEVVYDNNTSLHGRFLPKTRVPVRSPAEIPSSPFDDVVVFAYGYFDEIAEDLRPYLARGGRLHSLLDLLR